jgi:hypothetical protein
MDDHDFYSVNRLVEFGMGMSIAQQMVKTMNESMNNMHIPGAMNPIKTDTPNLYYAILDGAQAGPFSEQEIAQLIGNLKVTRETLFWKPGMSKWELAERIPEILKIVALTPPPIPENL